MGEMGEEQRLDQYWALSDLRRRLEGTPDPDAADRADRRPARYVRIEEGSRAEDRLHHPAQP